MTLRDLLTGAVQGNVMNNIPLGFAEDPKFNNFQYNISGFLGPSASDGVTSRNEGTRLFDQQSGIYNGMAKAGSSPSTGQRGRGASDVTRLTPGAIGAPAPSNMYTQGPHGMSGGFPWQLAGSAGRNVPSYMGSMPNTGHINQQPSYMGGGDSPYNPGWPYMPRNNTASFGGGGLRSSLVKPQSSFSFFG